MKIALLFPGYGSQYVGMGKELYDEYRIVQEYFEEASHCLNINCVKLCFASSDSELSRLMNAYAALFLMGCATYAVLKESGIEPDLVAGYNNGENAALFAASCFSVPDGLYLINKFCSFYQEFIDGIDVALIRVMGVDRAEIEDICSRVSTDENKVFIAFYNDDKDHILVGGADQISQVRDMVGESGRTEYQEAEIGLHSPLMDIVVNQFGMYLEKVDFKNLKIPCVSSVDGAIITEGIDVKERFIRHINAALRFDDVMKTLIDYDCIIVANPGGELVDMIKKEYPEKFVTTIEKKEHIDTLKQMLKNTEK